LADQTGVHPSQSTFPAVLTKKFDMDYISVAWPGNANNAVSRLVLEECQKLISQKQKFAVLIMWSFSTRFEFRFNYDTGQRISPWHSIGLWDLASDITQITNSFFNQNPSIEQHFAKHLKSAKNSGLSDFAHTFYKHVGDSEYYELYSSLKEFVFMQNYLKSHNIPYIFTSAENTFYIHENYQRRKDVYLENLYDQVDWQKWFFFPVTEQSLTQEPKGFFQWATENKYPMGTTHPLEAAHADAVKLIWEKFNELVAKNL
jgi:hypothetical protein